MQARQIEEAAAVAPRVDGIVPSRGNGLTALVGIGGGEGCAAALHDLVSRIPPHTGLAFIAMVHDEATERGLVARLRQAATMKFVEVQATVATEPDTFYFARPGPLIFMPAGQASLVDGETSAPVDRFFRAIADAWGPHSAAVLLPGGDSEGMTGLRRIKERGGLTVLTQPLPGDSDAEMSRGAIATGMVDWVLPPTEIARQLPEYFRRERGLAGIGEDDEALKPVLSLLRTQTGRDFSPYKRSMVLRRITHRMQLTGARSLAEYLQAMHDRPAEVAALLQDLFISATHFFHNAEDFDALAPRLHEMLRRKALREPVRVWVPACATGEEAYSIAMLLCEQASTLEAVPAMQVIATDPNEAAIQVAREGLFPSGIEADVSPERLQRFFVREPHGWRIGRELRERVLFARHDLLEDPPFSRMDLVSCRNFLAGLEPQARQRVLETFHFALRPEGLLQLGSSESLDEDTGLFDVLDKARALHARRSGPRKTVEQHEASTKELLASNADELQASNEELRKDKEELSKVNEKLKSKLDELSHADVDMHNFMSAAAIAVVFLDRELRITRYTPAAVKLFRLTSSDTGRPLAHLASRLHYPELGADAQGVLRQLVPVEREVGHEDGSWYLARLLPYRGFNDRIGGVVLSFVDITERKQAEEVRKWLSTVVDSTTDGIISFGLDRRILSWNAGAQGMFGYTAREAIGQTIAMLRPESESVVAEHLQQLQRGESLQFEALCQRKDGSEVQVALTVSPIRGHDGKVIGGTAIARDVTEARQAQEALVRSQAELVEALERNLMARRELEVADAAKDRFIAVLSHELRNPLASITSSAEVLAAPELAPSARAHAADVVRRQARSMRSLLDDLLDVARIRLGRLELHMEPLVLQDVVSQALETVQPLVDGRGHHLETHIPDAPLRIQADRLRLTQLLANLVGNAAKYTPHGGRIELSVEARGDKALVGVQDNGIGIEPGEIESMFELFAQSEDDARRRSSEGLGIGLSLARSIAALHQGTLTARSEGRGHGTRLELQLPLLEAAVEPERDEPKAASAQTPPGASQGQTILIADDNEDAVWALRKLLELSGFQVVTAGTGREAVAQAGQHRPAVVLLDIGLPDISGHEVARRIRAEPWGRDMKLVAVTGWGQDSDRRMSQQAGFNAHLTKPLDSSDIRRLLEDLGPGTMPPP